MAQLNDYEFAILGGNDISDRTSDIFTFAVDRDSLEKNSSFWNIFSDQFKFDCLYNQSTMV